MGHELDVTFRARNAEVDDTYRTTAIEKAQHSARFFERVGDIDVELSQEKNAKNAEDRFRLEITSLAAGHVVRVEASSETPEAALDTAVERFERQLRRLKERLISRSRRPEPVTASGSATATRNRIEEVVRVKQFVMKPMTLEEATLQMEMLGHDFFFFMNGDTDRQSVLYRRRDGRLGLIEPS